MTVTLGNGEWTFEVEESWAKIPDEIVLGDCAAVGVDSKDNIYAFNRGDLVWIVDQHRTSELQSPWVAS